MLPASPELRKYSLQNHAAFLRFRGLTSKNTPQRVNLFSDAAPSIIRFPFFRRRKILMVDR
jgi:hypothetical protein